MEWSELPRGRNWLNVDNTEVTQPRTGHQEGQAVGDTRLMVLCRWGQRLQPWGHEGICPREVFSQITVNVLATPQGTVTRPSVNLHFHTLTSCHPAMTDGLSVPNRLLLLSPSKAHSLSTSELSCAARTCSLRTENGLTKAARLQHNSVPLPSRQLPAVRSSWRTLLIQLHVMSPWCLQKAEDMVAVPMWALGLQGRLGKGNFFTSALVIQIDPHITPDETMTSLKQHSAVMSHWESQLCLPEPSIHRYIPITVKWPLTCLPTCSSNIFKIAMFHFASCSVCLCASWYHTGQEALFTYRIAYWHQHHLSWRCLHTSP